MTTPVSLSDQVAAAVLEHESSNPAQLTLSIAQSGYSVGITQYDFANKDQSNAQVQANLNNFVDLLNSTASETGLSAAQIQSIQSNITAIHGNPSVNALAQQIHQALATPAGLAFTQSLDVQDLDQDTSTVSGLIAAANSNPAGAGALANGALDPVAVAELSAYANQFGSVGKLDTFLATGTVQIDGNTLTSDGTLSLDDLNTNFFSKLAFYQDQNRYDNFTDSAETAGGYAASGQVIWDGDFSTPSSEVASNGDTTFGSPALCVLSILYSGAGWRRRWTHVNGAHPRAFRSQFICSEHAPHHSGDTFFGAGHDRDGAPSHLREVPDL